MTDEHTDAPALSPVEQLMSQAYSLDAEGVELFNLDALVPPDRKIQVGGRVYTVPTEIPLEMMMSFVRFEEKRATEEATMEEQFGVLREIEDLIRNLLAEHNDDVPEKLHLGVRRVPLLITHLTGGRTATEAVMNALSGGAISLLEKNLDDAYSDAEGANLIEPEDKGKVTPPLASAKRSSRHSSRSPKSSTGKRSGGKTPASARSARTSQQPAEKT